MDAEAVSALFPFLVTVALALPGGAILLWESVRSGEGRPHLPHG